jgi:hypothetical protein
MIPFLLFYLNIVLQRMESYIYPILLTVCYTPLIVWTLTLRKNETTAKYYIGAVKLHFSLSALPMVTMIFVNFADANMINTLNVYIVLMTALFFTLDGQTDLHDAFRLTPYSQSSVGKLADHVFCRLKRRFVVFMGIGTQLAATFLILFKELAVHASNVSPYLHTVLIGMLASISCFFLGWFSLALDSHKKIRWICTQCVENSDQISSWIDLLRLSLANRFLLTWFPFIIIALQFAGLAAMDPSSWLELLIAYFGVASLVYIGVRVAQHWLFRKLKYF